MTTLEWLFVSVLVAALVCLVIKAYFREKEAFVDRLVRKVRKGVGDNGKV